MKSHKKGELETMKFDHRRDDYENYISRLGLMGIMSHEVAEHFPAYAGHMTLNRCFTLYELYKKVLGISGHICEVGVYKGFGSLLFAKLTQIFEPESLTMVHAFDWFDGIEEGTDAALQVAGGDSSDESSLREIIELQKLDHILKIHRMDARKDWPSFFERYPHLRFKLIFLDSGTYNVTRASITALWPRLNVGGIMIFDQYNNEVAPGETKAIHELLPDVKIETLPNSWMPSAFVRKV
jgi:hypothetical protein